MPFEVVGDVVGVFQRKRVDEKPVCAERGIVAGLSLIDFTGERHEDDLQLAQFGRTVDLFRRFPKSFQMRGQVVGSLSVADPPVSACDSPAICGRAMAADDDRRAARAHRTRMRVDVFEVDVAAMIGGTRFVPERSHRVDVFVGPAPSFRPGAGTRVEIALPLRKG